jgi:hypothetical protein
MTYMRSFVTPRNGHFWERYAALPEEIQTLADKSYELLKRAPKHPSFD